MINNRDSFRLRKQMDLSWSVPEQKIEGQGKIYNMSSSGMSFETDRLFSPEHGMSILFKIAEIPSFPAKGKLIWFKKVGEGKNHYHCGIRFLKDGTFNRGWIKWMEDNIQQLADTGDNKILNQYLGTGEPE